MLTVKDFMQKNIITVYEDTSVYVIAKTLSDRNISCVLVIERVVNEDVVVEAPSFWDKLFRRKKQSRIHVKSPQRPLGIISDKDFILKVLSRKLNPQGSVAKHIMTSDLVTIDSKSSIINVINLMTSNHFRRLPVVEDGHLAGLVTQTDILVASVRMLEGLRGEMDNISVDMDEYRELLARSSELYDSTDKPVDVEDPVDRIMVRDVFSHDVDTTVYEAACGMAEKNLSCVIVTHEGRPVGIVSEKDFVKKVVVGQLDPDKTTLGHIMTSPIYSIPSRTKINDAVRLMRAKGFRRLPVVEDNVLLGLITQSDLRKSMGAAVKKAQSELVKKWADLLEPAFRKKGIGEPTDVEGSS